MIDFKIGQLQITNNETKYKLEGITGINGFEKNLNLLDLAGQDGSEYGSSKIPSREIVATISPVGNIEQNRLDLVSAVKSSNIIPLYFKTDTRDCFIWAKSKNFDADSFSERQAGQIAFTCADPFFRNTESEEVLINPTTVGSTVLNNGDIPVDFSANVTLNQVTEDITQIALERKLDDSLEQIVIKYADGFESGDQILIENTRDEKSVSFYRDGVKRNITSAIDWTVTKWFKLGTGSNKIRYKINGVYDYSGNFSISCNLLFQERYVSI